jgi:hypothetical protein
MKKSLILAIVAFCGCHHTDPGDSGPGIPLSSAADEVAKAVCPKAWSCCTAAQLMDNDMAGTDEPSCETKTAQGFKNNFDSVRSSQSKGRSVYDGLQLQACLSYIRSSSCDTLNMTSHFTGVPGCDSFVKPKLSVGAACSFDGECIDGYCDKPQMASEGTCKPRARENESCEVAACAKNLVCDGAKKLCVMLFADGSSCTEAAQCASYVCNKADGGSGTCGPASPADQCFYRSACRYGCGPASPLALLVTLGITGALARRRRDPARTRPGSLPGS